MRRVILAAECDGPCGHVYFEDADIKVRTIPFMWAGEEREIDLDKPCEDTVGTWALNDLLARSHVTPKGKKKDPSLPSGAPSKSREGLPPADPFYEPYQDPDTMRFWCPYEEAGEKCGQDDLKSAGALATHFKRIHKVSIKDWVGEPV